MSSYPTTQDNDEIKLAKYVRDSLRISENLTKHLKACIDKKAVGKNGNLTGVGKISSSLKNDNKDSTKKKIKQPVKHKYSIKSEINNSKIKKKKQKQITLNEEELRRAEIRKELPTAVHGDLRIGTSYVNGKAILNMRCNPRNEINYNNFCSENSSEDFKLIKHKSSTDSILLNSDDTKNLHNSKKENSIIKKVSKKDMSTKRNVNGKRKNVLKNTPHVFDPLNSKDTYPNIVRSPITPHSTTSATSPSCVTSEIPYYSKTSTSKNKKNKNNNSDYQEVPGTHVGFLIKTFKINPILKTQKSIFDMVFDLSINVGKKQIIPLNVIANFSSDRNPVVATNGCLFVQQ